MQVAVGNGHVDFLVRTGYVTLTGKPVSGYRNRPVRGGIENVDRIYRRLERFSKTIKRIRSHPKMPDLWKGKWEQHYPSQSEADLAFIKFIAPLLDYDVDLIDELFRQCGLCRSKWLNRKDYRDSTIRKALTITSRATRDIDYLLDRLILVSEEKAGNVSWLWDKRIPIGEFSAIAGDPEAGKGTSYASLVAAVTTGGSWPAGTGNAPSGKVVIFTTEDDVATVIKPRIVAAGGDPSQVYVMRDSFTFKDDRAAFEKMLQEIQPIWAIFDPGKPYIGRLRNPNDDTEIREILDPVAPLLAKYQLACTLVYHLTKDEGRDLIHRLLGSIAHVAYPRAVWAVGENPRHRGQPRVRGFMPLKNNLYDKRKVGGLEFIIEGADLEIDGETIKDVSQAVWLHGVVMMVATEYFAKPSSKKVAAAQEDAEDLLEDHGGEMSAVDLQQELINRGHSKRTIRRALEGLDLSRSHSGKKQPGQHKVKQRPKKSSDHD